MVTGLLPEYQTVVSKKTFATIMIIEEITLAPLLFEVFSTHTRTQTFITLGSVKNSENNSSPEFSGVFRTLPNI